MWQLGTKKLTSRLLLGTARYPSPTIMKAAIESSGTELVTVSLRRELVGKKKNNLFWEILQSCPVEILPNTAGCHSVKEAVTTAQMARDLFQTDLIKLEVIAQSHQLQPNPFGLVEAARILCREGFTVLPYTTEDPVVAEQLLDAGCKVIMPWGSPIGSGRGLEHEFALRHLRDRFRDIPLIIDAGIGCPSHAVKAMEMGFDGVLLNTAVAIAHNPVGMAKAFGQAIACGRLAYESGLMPKRESAVHSSPVLGTPFWREENRI